PERAVEPNGEWPCMSDRGPERVDRLARQRATGRVGDRARDDEWDAVVPRVVGGFDAEDGGLRVQRVEDRLDDEQVRAALDEALGGFLVGSRQLVEGHVAGA